MNIKRDFRSGLNPFPKNFVICWRFGKENTHNRENIEIVRHEYCASRNLLWDVKFKIKGIFITIWSLSGIRQWYEHEFSSFFYNILEVVIICVNICDVGTRNLTKPVGDSWSSFWVTYNWFCGVGFSPLGSWWFLNHCEFWLRSRATMGRLIFIFVAFLLGTAHPTSVVGKKINDI